MPRITSLDELERMKIELVMKRNQAADQGIVFVTVGMGTCGIAAGALEVFKALEAGISANHLNHVVLTQTGCMGLCGHEPIVEVTAGNEPRVSYGKVTSGMVERILREHLIEGTVVEELVIDTTPFPTL